VISASFPHVCRTAAVPEIVRTGGAKRAKEAVVRIQAAKAQVKVQGLQGTAEGERVGREG
jgi:hypothetical protein